VVLHGVTILTFEWLMVKEKEDRTEVLKLIKKLKRL
jgi:hypothetical protein